MPSQTVSNQRLRARQSGYGIVLLMAFVFSSILIATSFMMGNGFSGASLQAQKDFITAKQVASSGMVFAQRDIQAQLDAGTAVTTAYRFPATAGTYNTINVPNDPNNLSGANSVVGSYYATVTNARGNSYLVQVTATAGGATYSQSQLFLMARTLFPLSKLFARFLGRAGFFTGASVSSAGDVNNDGYPDLLIGSVGNDSYLVMGRSQAGWNSLTDASGNFSLLNTSKANQTVRFTGRVSGDRSGASVSSAGDVNNDGYTDLLIGANLADGGATNSGESYLVMGRSQTNWDALTDASGNFSLLNTSKANQTVRFIGRALNDDSGISVSSAGDVNHDGYGDLIIGAHLADPVGFDSGESYLVMGRSQTNWDALTDASGNFSLLNTSKANQTVRFTGRVSGDNSGYSVSSAGDVNNDGYADLLIGARYAGGGGSQSGEAYLVMGRSQTNWDALTDASGNFSLLNMSKAIQTVRFIGRAAAYYSGYSVSSAGDVNHDGYADLLIGANDSPNGEAYLVMGRSQTNWDALTDASGNFSLLNMSKANQTVRFVGRVVNDWAGASVSSAGDVNNDGYADLLIGAFFASGGGSSSGESYLVMGRSQTNWDALTDASGNFSLLNTSKANQTVRFTGRAASDQLGYSVNSAGDVNNDGYADLLISAYNASGGGANSGEAYLIMGRSQTAWDALSDASGNVNLLSISLY